MDAPTIKPYMEDRWATLPDVQSTPLEVSPVPARLAARPMGGACCARCTPQDWKRTFNHPELGTMPLEKNLALYSWHAGTT